jgi:uncharacterized repeat protein (TIGR01451 family)
LAITNSGPADASGVIVVNSLPAQVSFISSTPGSPQCSHSGSSVSCNLGQLNAHSSQKVTIVAAVNLLASGSLTDDTQVTASTPDPDQGNNSAQEVTTVIPTSSPLADLVIGIDSTPDPVDTGQSITYTVAITNNGPANAAGVVVTNSLPSQASFLSSSPASPDCSQSGRLVTCNLGQLNASGSRQVTIVARISDIANGVITDTGQVTSSTLDPNQQNNAVDHQTTVINTTGIFYRLFLPVTR